MGYLDLRNEQIVWVIKQIFLGKGFMLVFVMWRFSFEGISDLFVFYYQLSGVFYEGLSFGVDGFVVLEEVLWLYVDYFFFGVGFYGFGYQY